MNDEVLPAYPMFTAAKVDMQAALNRVVEAAEAFEIFCKDYGWPSLPAPVRDYLEAQSRAIDSQMRLICAIHGIDPENIHARRQ